MAKKNRFFYDFIAAPNPVGQAYLGLDLFLDDR
jgi:hypothetical protein